MYSFSSRILHLGNVANTGFNMVGAARQSGRNWALREIPAAPSIKSPRAWLSRASDALRYATDVPLPDLAHVHYGPNGYYGELKRAPFVLHLHGSDVRVDLHRPLLGDLERRGLEKASAVLVATPDLLPLVSSLRPDVQWLPNCLPVAAARMVPEIQAEQTGDACVFFSARWDDSKGGLGLVEAAAKLVSDGVTVLGVDWGAYAPQAREVGVRLLPKMSPHQFRNVMQKSSVVVGQFGPPVLSISDLEALASGTPLVAHLTSESVEYPPAVKSEVGQIQDHVNELLADRSVARRVAEESMAWVLEERSPENTVSALERVYANVLG